mmetsp:Transcript_20106/g.66556  ORF Transcript_20106/g.66556 Transcript_20106/m.66556 type:complete len:222 (-) Transcript_20106:420-1085(-)
MASDGRTRKPLRRPHSTVRRIPSPLAALCARCGRQWARPRCWPDPCGTVGLTLLPCCSRPGMHPYDGRVVSNFIMQAINGEDITVYGEGKQTRSFCFVDDLVDGLMKLMNQTSTIGPVNIGNPGEFTIKQLAELAIKHTGSSSKIVHLPLPGDDPQQRKPDITKAREILGWEPKIKLEDGLPKAVAYFSSLDLSRFRKPTKHTAHLNTDAQAADATRASKA